MQLVQVYTNIESYVSDYSKEIPVNTAQAMLTSFAISFAVTTILTANPTVGAIHGSFSAVATGIHGLVTPLFKQLSGNNTHLSWSQNLLRTAVSKVGSCYFAAACGYSFTLKSLIISLIFNACINNGISRRRLDKANYIFV